MPHPKGTQPSGIGMLDRAVHVWGQLPLPSTHTLCLQHPALALPGVHAPASLPSATTQTAQLEKMPNIPGRESYGPTTPCPCPLHYPRI